MRTYKDGCLDTIDLIINTLTKELVKFSYDDISYTCITLQYIRELEIIRMNIKEMKTDEESGLI